MASSRLWYRRNRSAASWTVPNSSKGWNASKVCIAPVKLIVRGATPCRGLGHHGAEEVVGQDVRPYLLVHQVRRLAPQLAHLHRRLEGPQVKLIMPPRAVQRRQVLLGRLLGIQQRRHHHDRPGPKAWLSNADPRLPNRDVVRQFVVR